MWAVTRARIATARDPHTGKRAAILKLRCHEFDEKELLSVYAPSSIPVTSLNTFIQFWFHQFGYGTSLVYEDWKKEELLNWQLSNSKYKIKGQGFTGIGVRLPKQPKASHLIKATNLKWVKRSD